MLTFEYTPLMTALKTLKKVIDARASIPIMQHITVNRDAFGRAVIGGSDLESWLSITVEGSHIETEAGAFTLSRADLEKVLMGGDKGKLVTASVQHGENRDGHVTVTHDGVSVDLDILPIADFPEAPDVIGTVQVPLSYNTLRGVMSYCAGAMSSEETRYYLQGIYLHQFGESGKLAVVATDGHRLNLAETGTCYNGDGAIMRDDAVHLILHLMGKVDGTVQVCIPQDGRNQFQVTGDGWNLVTRKIDGTFPMYSRVIPQEPKGKGTLPCGDVAKAAARICRITSKTGASILDIAAGTVRHGGTGAGIKSVSIDVGDMFPSGDVEPIGLNPVYLEHVMKQMQEFSDTCTVRVTDAVTPIRVHPRSMPCWAENITSVVMPMRY